MKFSFENAKPVLCGLALGNSGFAVMWKKILWGPNAYQEDVNGIEVLCWIYIIMAFICLFMYAGKIIFAFDQFYRHDLNNAKSVSAIACFPFALSVFLVVLRMYKTDDTAIVTLSCIIHTFQLICMLWFTYVCYLQKNLPEPFWNTGKSTYSCFWTPLDSPPTVFRQTTRTPSHSR